MLTEAYSTTIPLRSFNIPMALMQQRIVQACVLLLATIHLIKYGLTVQSLTRQKVKVKNDKRRIKKALLKTN